ncbi:unnamed protein product, partial [Ectocarpus fasciculatus]
GAARLRRRHRRREGLAVHGRQVRGRARQVAGDSGHDAVLHVRRHHQDRHAGLEAQGQGTAGLHRPRGRQGQGRRELPRTGLRAAWRNASRCGGLQTAGGRLQGHSGPSRQRRDLRGTRPQRRRAGVPSPGDGLCRGGRVRP